MRLTPLPAALRCLPQHPCPLSKGRGRLLLCTPAGLIQQLVEDGTLVKTGDGDAFRVAGPKGAARASNAAAPTPHKVRIRIWQHRERLSCCLALCAVATGYALTKATHRKRFIPGGLAGDRHGSCAAL